MNYIYPNYFFVKKSKKIFFYQLELDKRVKIEIFKGLNSFFFNLEKKLSTLKREILI